MLPIRFILTGTCHLSRFSGNCIKQDLLYSQSYFYSSRGLSSNMSKIKKRYDNITKSSEDKREYRGLELTNGMKIVVVSDSSTEKSAAAMSVNVGFLSDPNNLPGLAHFCEHMLFLGTKNYPQENEYTKFLSEHGGSSNASTVAEHTSYYFDVSAEHLPQALDRFAQFFIEPLFNEDVTDREVNAVDSEHDKNRQSDAWRFDQLEKSFSKAGHPYRKFGTGNKETLDIIPKQKGLNVRDELLKFHKKWYSSNVMTLAIIGKESLDELEKMAADLFSQVEDKKVVPLAIKDHPYSDEEVKVKVSVVPIKDTRHLAVSFPIPDYRDYYKAAPGQYLSHLIGHEGSGSLLSALRAKGWCNNLVGGTRGEIQGFDMFCVSVDLTEEGIEHIDDIVHFIFQYIKMLKNEGPKKWVFDEQAELLNMHFRFKDKQSSTALVNSISVKLNKYPIEEVLIAGYKLTDWRSDLINELLGYLNAKNVRISIAGKKFQGTANLKEEWYGTEYSLEKIPDYVIQRWQNCELNSDFHLPGKNEFIATDFDLSPRDENPSPHPTIIHETEYCRVWYKQDNEFLLPKTNIRFEFVSPFAYLDPMSCNMTYMFVSLFKDALLEYAYAAQLAGLKWELTNTKYGMVLGIGGYNHKQKVLLEKIMDKMTNFTVDPKRFSILKENYIRSLKNFNAEQPYQHANYYLAVLLSEQSWPKNELLEATDKLTIPALEAFIQQLLSKVHVESFIHGNTCKATAMDMVNTVMDRLSGTVGL